MHLESLDSTPEARVTVDRATLKLLSRSTTFVRASLLDVRTAESMNQLLIDCGRSGDIRFLVLAHKSWSQQFSHLALPFSQ